MSQLLTRGDPARASGSARRPTRRSILLATALALAGLPSCGLLNPVNPENPPAPGGLTPDSAPTPARILGIIPIPPAPTPAPTPQPIAIKFGHWESGPARATLELIAQDFARTTPNVVIRADPLPFQAHFDRIQVGRPAGDVPDAFVSSGSYIYRQAADNVLLDLTARAAEAGIKVDDFWTDPATRPLNGRLASVPLWASSEIAYVNRDRITQIGAVPPTGAWNWNDFLDLAGRLTVGKPGEVSHWGTLVVNDLVGGWGSFATSNGGSWLDVATRKTALDPATVETLHWVRDAILVHHVAPRPLEQQSLTHGGTVDAFLAGDVSIFPTGTWEMSAAIQGARFNWDVVRLPAAPKTGSSVSLASVQPGCGFRGTGHADETWLFLRYLASAAAQRRWNDGKLRIPALKSVSASFGTPPPANASAAAAALTNAADFKFTTNWQQFRSAILAPLEEAFNGLTDLDAAIARAVEAGDAALGL